MLYLDTSLVVSSLVQEPLSDAVRGWLAEQSRQDLYISDWTTTEVAAALAQKMRLGIYDDAARRSAADAFRHVSREGLDVAGVLRVDFIRASSYAEEAGTVLRAGDALHLAVASRLGATLHTLDVRQADAGRQLGLDAVLTLSGE